MEAEFSFGAWVQQRRKALDFTQGDLARRVGCAVITIQKFEADERRPSRQIAERLAEHLRIPPNERAAFLDSARGTGTVDRLSAPAVLDDQTSTASTRPNTLPVPLTSFIGRKRELAATAGLLASSRLLTLTGPGGTGKTRLAVQLATMVRGRFPSGVWLVELARLDDPTLLAQTIATALGLREEPGRALLTTLTVHLHDQQLLLVLDNCEHLIDTCAPLAEALLRACPRLRILASSREPLGIGGEAIFRVPPLTAPDPRQLPPSDQLAEFEAVQLFVARAQAVQPAFQLTEANAAALAQICHRLDGIPLAIELAAVRVRMLPLAQIAVRLDDRFRLLTGGSRTALPRHQTLEALIDWSYELLGEDERVLLRRLAVFVGGWTIEAAEAVCESQEMRIEDSGWKIVAPSSILYPLSSILDGLTALVDKSLVEVDPGDEAARYRLLETIRQYALGKLAASGEADAIRRRHTRYYLGLAEAWAHGRPDVTWAERAMRLETEHDNLRAALAWSQAAAGGAEIALRLVNALEGFWAGRGYWTEADCWLTEVLAHPEGQARTPLRAEVLLAWGIMHALLNDYAAARVAFTESLTIYEELGDIPGRAWVLNRFGWLAREQGDGATARDRLEESLALYRAQGERHRYSVSNGLNTLAEVAVMQGDAAWATALLEESLALARSLDDPYLTAWALNHLGHVAQIQHEYGRATQLHMESLVLFRDAGEHAHGLAWAFQGLGESALAQRDLAGAREWFIAGLAQFRHLGDRAGLAWCLAGLGSVAGLSGQPARAARLWGAAEGLRTTLGARPAPAARVTYERVLDAVRAELGAEALAAAWDDGQALPLEHAIASAVEDEPIIPSDRAARSQSR